MRLVPFASCRVWNPLLAMNGTQGISVPRLTDGPTLYLHTPREALQTLRIIRGELKLDPAWYCYLDQAAKLNFVPGAAEMVAAADVVPLEVCTEKEYYVGDIVLHDNEVQRVLDDRTSGKRDEWRAIIDRGDVPTAEQNRAKLDWLASKRPLTPVDEEVVNNLRQRRLDLDRMIADIREFQEAVGRPIVIVPHIPFRTEDGRLLASRQTVIERARAAAAALNLPCFDHEPIIELIGQHFLLQEEGRDSSEIDPPVFGAVGRAMVNFIQKHGRAASPRSTEVEQAALLADAS